MTDKKKLVNVEELPIAKQLKAEQQAEDDFTEKIRLHLSGAVGWEIPLNVAINYVYARTMLTGMLLKTVAESGAAHAQLQISNPATDQRFEGGGYLSLIPSKEKTTAERCEVIATSTLRAVLEANNPKYKSYGEGMLALTRERENPTTVAAKFVIIPRLILFQEL